MLNLANNHFVNLEIKDPVSTVLMFPDQINQSVDGCGSWRWSSGCRNAGTPSLDNERNSFALSLEQIAHMPSQPVLNSTGINTLVSQ